MCQGFIFLCSNVDEYNIFVPASARARVCVRVCVMMQMSHPEDSNLAIDLGATYTDFLSEPIALGVTQAVRLWVFVCNTCLCCPVRAVGKDTNICA